jgi:predicted nucleic acid-binding Zn ribbon protein
MRKAGDILTSMFQFDPNFFAKAKTYHDLFSSWTAMTEETGIPSASAHSRIEEFDKSVLLIEADHPGWIQVLQIKQSELLDAARRRFPNLGIQGISFHLSREPFEP